ncbi:MAG: DUF2461 domain-containing protein [Cyclobacteriaceae bacterium]
MNIQFTLDFLSDLAKNNKKEWMDDNKKRYNEAKGYVIELVAEVIEKAAVFDKSLVGVEPKKTLFRINRDIRFSNNKDPYKTNFGAAIVDGGRKSGNPGYYLHIKPGENMVGGGLYQPDPAILQKVRQEIDYNGGKLRKIIENKQFKEFYKEPYDGDKLKTAPKGYPKDHPDLDLLQLKHYVFMEKLPDKEATGAGFSDKVVKMYHTLYPFNQFLSEAIS